MKRLIALLLAVVLCVGLFAGCAKKQNEDLLKAKEYLYSLYVDKPTVTAKDLEYPAKVKGGSTFFEVEWTVEILSGKGEVKVVPSETAGFVVVDVPEEPEEDIVYKLTATIKDAEGKQTETLSYEYTVPKFSVNSFDEYVAAEAGAALVTQGVVTGLIAKSQGASYNCIYYQDADGGYYAYGLAEDPITDLKLEVGMTIRVTGEKDIYSGTHEMKNVSVKIISSEKTDVVVHDFTEIYKNAADLKDNALVYQQAQLVTIKGVEITGQDPSNGYYKFKLGELESYIRISGSTCPLNKEQKDAFIAGHTEHLGWIANVTGVICVYNGAFYLTPVSVDAFEYISLPDKSDAEKIKFEIGNLTFPGIIDANTEIELPAAGMSYTDVAITWAVEGEGAAIVDGKLVITIPSANTAIKLTATLTCGEETGEAVFDILLLATELTYEEIVKMAYALQPGESLPVSMILKGVITSVDTAWSDQYNNITVTIQVGDMADQKIMCFRLKGDGAKDLKVGDVITVEGILKNYNGTIEFDAGCQLLAVEGGSGNEGGNEGGNDQPTNGDTDGMSLTIKEAIERAQKAGNAGTTIKYKITGKVTEVTNTTYGNFYIEDATGRIYVYGCYSADGKVRYDEMDNFPQEGDTVTLYGVLSTYNDAPQMKNAWCLSGGTGKQESGNQGGNDQPATGDTDGMVLTIKEAIERAVKAGDAGTTIKYKVTGTVTQVTNDTYGNFYIEDATGSIFVYGCYSADGELRYDAMDNFPQEGDTVTLYGVLCTYNETPQMKNVKCLSGGTGKHEDQPSTGDTDGMQLTIAEAIERAVKAGEAGTTIKYKVTGTVTEVTNDTYGNFYIEDATGSIFVYGCYSADGELRYDAMDNFPQEGDTVTLYGVLCTYNETPQMKNVKCLSGGTGKHTTAGGKEDTSYMTAPQVGVAFKLGLYQGNNGEQVYFSGTSANKEYYMATTTDKNAAVDMYLEEVEGGYRMYFMDGGTKTYLDIYQNGSYVNLRLTTDPTAVFVWDSTYNTLVADVEGVKYFIGTYSTYSTLSASNYDKYVAENFVVHLYP